jgi:hypothetical protein
MTHAETRFVAVVERHLGPPESIERTQRGRLVLRYRDYTVSGNSSQAIAARFRNGRALFAVVGEGRLQWSENRPHALVRSTPGEDAEVTIPRFKGGRGSRGGRGRRRGRRAYDIASY